MALGEKRRARRRRTLRVRRVIRRVELRSVLKLAFITHACCYGVTLGVGALLWKLALRYDLVHNVEKFMSEIGFAQDFRIHGASLWKVLVRGGAILVVLNTVGTLLLAFFYNAVAGLLGGVVLSMLEEVPLTRAGPPVNGRAAAPVALSTGKPATSPKRKRRLRKRRERLPPPPFGPPIVAADASVPSTASSPDPIGGSSLATPSNGASDGSDDVTEPLPISIESAPLPERDWADALAPANGAADEQPSVAGENGSADRHPAGPVPEAAPPG